MINDYVYLLKITDPENGRVVEYKTFVDAKRALNYLLEKCEKDNYMYDHYLKLIGVNK